MKIGIDLDNVLNNLTREWINTYNLNEGSNIALEDVTDYNMTSNEGITTNIFKYFNDELMERLVPLPDSIKVTEQLGQDHELFIITATYPENMKIKMEWLAEHFPHIPKRNIIVTSRKEMINIDVLIDDAPENVYNFNQWDRVIVFDYAWNRQVDENTPRVKDWSEVMDKINELGIYVQ